MSVLRDLRFGSRPPAPHVARAVGRAFASWRDPRSPLRSRLRLDHPVFSGPVVEAGLDLGLSDWDDAAIDALRSGIGGRGSRAPDVTVVWLGGCIPTAAFTAMALPLLTGSSLYVKVASADPVSPTLFRDSLLEADPGLADAVRIGGDPGDLSDADAVVVYGSDAAVNAVRSRVPVHAPFVGHGHRISVATIGRECDASAAAHAVAVDVALWDGRGCLSPGWVLVEDHPPGRAESVARALAGELETLSRSLPRGSVDAAEEAWIHDVRASAAMQPDSTVLAPGRSTHWTVIRTAAGATPDPGRLRCIPVVPFSDLDALAAWCARLSPHLSSLGEMGWGGRHPPPAAVVARGGGSRVCPLGRMQAPRPDWHHDGIDPLRALVRHVDVEGNG